MPTLVLDIETLGVDFDSMDDDVQRALMRSAEQEPTEERRAAARENVRTSMALWPPTARVIAIGMLHVESGGARIYYESPHAEDFSTEDGQVRCIGLDEKGALEGFWRDVRAFHRLVTFNGRSFDAPFLMLRSAFHGLRPTRNLLPYRYDHRQHTDLLDQLTFYGATRKFSLDLYCRAFGIESPKRYGVSGRDVGDLYRAGKHRDIALYCLRDVKATAELYERWRRTLCFDGAEPMSSSKESASI